MSLILTRAANSEHRKHLERVVRVGGISAKCPSDPKDKEDLRRRNIAREKKAREALFEWFCASCNN